MLRVAAFLMVWLVAIGAASALEPEASPGPALPQQLTMARALELFEGRGYDLLIAEASVEQAAGNRIAAGAIPNPAVSLGAGRNFLCATAQDCGVISYSVGLSDSNAISNFLSGKTGLKKGVAQAALEAAKLSRVDALRTLSFQVKSAYIQVLLAEAQLATAHDNRASNEKTQALMKKSYELGQISDAELATIDVATLESFQTEDQATQTLRAAKVALAFLLGFRQAVPDFQVQPDELVYAMPEALKGLTREALIDRAMQERPDLRALRELERGSESAVTLAHRQRVPDFAVGAVYSDNGKGDSNISPPNVSVNLSFNLPVFYLQKGEIQAAEAARRIQQAQRLKAEALVVADVETAFGQLMATRSLVERMNAGLLARAKTARDLIELQRQKGKASLLDLLNAQRTFNATRVEYAVDLANYWTAVAQLEQATASELRR
jgi:cobalt-zinc-cadmium efflux system outer membrane protein